jgi:hypothetical protein
MFSMTRWIARSSMSTVNDNLAPQTNTGEKHPMKHERDEAIAHLRKIIQPGDTVYTVLRHVSKSGMTRGIDLYVLSVENGKASPMWITSYVGKAIDRVQSRADWEKSRGIRVTGCGMDMGFDLVYTLSRVLFQGMPDRNGDPTENNDKGYWLKHEWLSTTNRL